MLPSLVSERQSGIFGDHSGRGPYIPRDLMVPELTTPELATPPFVQVAVSRSKSLSQEHGQRTQRVRERRSGGAYSPSGSRVNMGRDRNGSPHNRPLNQERRYPKEAVHLAGMSGYLREGRHHPRWKDTPLLEGELCLPKDFTVPGRSTGHQLKKKHRRGVRERRRGGADPPPGSPRAKTPFYDRGGGVLCQHVGGRYLSDNRPLIAIFPTLLDSGGSLLCPLTPGQRDPASWWNRDSEKY